VAEFTHTHTPVNQDTQCVPVGVIEALLDVIQGFLGLIRIPRADLFQHGRADLMQRHLQDLLFNVPRDVVSVYVCDIKVEVEGTKQHRLRLLNDVEDVDLDLLAHQCTKIVDAKE
jgi:hypothetical protein